MRVAHPLRPAADAESAHLWRAVSAAHLFASQVEFERFRMEAPWRVLSDGAEEAAVLERWRAHLDVLAIKGVWCTRARLPDVVRALAAVASRQGFGRVLSPLVAQRAARDYERAGMQHYCFVVAARFDMRGLSRQAAKIPPAVTLRTVQPEDLSAIVAIDASCFDEFWRYDSEHIERHFAEDRLVVAEEGGTVIGYTHSTLVRDIGTVGRLAVEPGSRNRGVGRALLTEAIGTFARAGAGSVSLCTQEGNAASRSLYRASGFEELTGRLVLLMATARMLDRS